LPLIFGTSAATIPQVVTMQAQADIAHKWKDVLAGADTKQLQRIGVVWAGNADHKNDRNRSIPFDLFAKLFENVNVRWISLQVGQHATDVDKKPYPIVNFSRDLVDFSETAGLIENLDLLITVDTAVAHLAGSMGKTTWLLLPYSPDWRWQLQREDSPWYPSMRLFRQQKAGEWQDVLERVDAELLRYLS
jgi:hypothetical protein